MSASTSELKASSESPASSKSRVPSRLRKSRSASTCSRDPTPAFRTTSSRLDSRLATSLEGWSSARPTVDRPVRSIPLPSSTRLGMSSGPDKGPDRTNDRDRSGDCRRWPRTCRAASASSAISPGVPRASRPPAFMASIHQAFHPRLRLERSAPELAILDDEGLDRELRLGVVVRARRQLELR